GGEKICVHGDYDVDGVCAAALLTRTLRKLGADVDVCVPHRQLDGYDLQPDTVRRLAEGGVRVIVTVDCGVAAFPAAEAAGRLGAAEHALRLFLTEDAAEAQRLAEKLDRFNRERQTEQERIYSEAVRQAQNFTHDRILVLASARWHPGVIGNVASRMVEAHARPAILISLNEETATGRGSARSIPGFHMLDALTA